VINTNNNAIQTTPAEAIPEISAVDSGGELLDAAVIKEFVSKMSKEDDKLGLALDVLDEDDDKLEEDVKEEIPENDAAELIHGDMVTDAELEELTLPNGVLELSLEDEGLGDMLLVDVLVGSLEEVGSDVGTNEQLGNQFEVPICLILTTLIMLLE